MVARVREFLNKSSWLGWVLALMLAGLSAFFYMRRSGGGDAYSPEKMREEVTIRFTDTNDEITMPRGRVDVELRRRGGKLDPSEGIVNPKTGKPTGFPFNKTEWEAMCERINKERDGKDGSVRPLPSRTVEISPETAKILETAPAAPSAPSAPGAPPAPSPK